MNTLISRERFMELKKKHTHTLEYGKCNYLVYYTVYGCGSPHIIGTMTIRETLNLIKESDCKVYVQYNNSSELYAYPYFSGMLISLDTMPHIDSQDPKYLYTEDILQIGDLNGYDILNNNWFEDNPV